MQEIDDADVLPRPRVTQRTVRERGGCVHDENDERDVGEHHRQPRVAVESAITKPTVSTASAA